MVKYPRSTAEQAEQMLLEAGFLRIRSKGGHRIYQKDSIRFVLPYHAGKILHPKIITQLFDTLR